METITKAKMQILQKELKSIFPQLEEKVGLKFELNSIRFGAIDGKATINFVLANGDNNGLTPIEVKAKNDWELYYQVYDFEKDWLNKEFNSNGSRYRVMGIKPRSTKYPVLTKRTDNNQLYQMTAEMILDKMKK